MTQTLAIYGGSFDPPHLAHTLVCAYVLGAYEIDRVIVVPAKKHAFDKPLAPFEDRLQMCAIALRDLKHVELSTIERELAEPSLTLHTLEALHAREPDALLRLVIGSDLVAETPSWHRFDRICELAPPLIVARAGAELAGSSSPALPAISSSDARQRLREGRPTAGLLAPEVAAYAIAHGLYR